MSNAMLLQCNTMLPAMPRAIAAGDAIGDDDDDEAIDDG